MHFDHDAMVQTRISAVLLPLILSGARPLIRTESPGFELPHVFQLHAASADVDVQVIILGKHPSHARSKPGDPHGGAGAADTDHAVAVGAGHHRNPAASKIIKVQPALPVRRWCVRLIGSKPHLDEVRRAGADFTEVW